MPADCRHTSALCVAQAETALDQLEELAHSGLSSYRPWDTPSCRFCRSGSCSTVRRRHTREPLARRHCPCRHRSRSAVACEGHLLRFRHTFRFRMAPIVNAYGAYMHRASRWVSGTPTTPCFSLSALSRMTCPLQPNSAGAPADWQYEPTESGNHAAVTAARTAICRAPQGLAELDNGSEVFGYRVRSGGAFFRSRSVCTPGTDRISDRISLSVSFGEQRKPPEKTVPACDRGGLFPEVSFTAGQWAGGTGGM